MTLFEEVVVAKIATTAQHGAMQDKTQTTPTNYYNLDEKQIRQLEHAVTGYFDYIEDLIERENVFTMEEFSRSVNEFLEFRRYDILKDNGRISHKQAVEKAYQEYDIFNKTQPIESDFDEEEYKREAFYQVDMPVAPDVKNEQEKINSSDAIVFIYPDFWTASPALLEGWFQRVWTYGFAYGDNPSMKVLDKAMFLVTMGGSLKDEIRQLQLDAMKMVMVGDQIRNRAKFCEVYAFDEMTRGYNNDKNREERMIRFKATAYGLGYNL